MLKCLSSIIQSGYFISLNFACTAQKMKFSVKDSSVNVTKSAENCGFGHICRQNP